MDSQLTKYEKARVIGLRALHISRGAKTTIIGMTDPYLMAKRELEQGICPIIIRRHYPDGEYRDVSLRKLSSNNKNGLLYHQFRKRGKR